MSERDALEVEPAVEKEVSGETPESLEAPEPREPMPPVESRFMFVDIAALRAKQLRRGAVPRITLVHEGEGEESRKLERIAMREVEEGLIVYEIPEVGATDAEKGSEDAS